MMPHIMIVDDETAIVDLIEVYLKIEGYTVHKFYNATDALPTWNPFWLALIPTEVNFNILTLLKQVHGGLPTTTLGNPHS